MGYSSLVHALISFVEASARKGSIDYRELEKQTGFSQVYVREIFRKNTGHSLGNYVRVRKIWYSTFDLLHSDDTILDIALSYGFSSNESYTRAFQKIVGMTPSRFRQIRPVVGKKELAVGIYGIGLIHQIENRSDIHMDKEKYADNTSTVLYGVPRVGWGAYGGSTPYPICLKACLDYQGEEISYSDIIVAGGSAFRLTWNQEEWDLSNVDIYHALESPKIYQWGAEALGREFYLLERDKETKKEDFIQFIKQHLDEGYPCIAQGIIGPPEACLITGYRDNGNVLLGWNFFQDDLAFANDIGKDESGYFICDNWWENTDTQGIMCMGPVYREPFSRKRILENAVHILSGRIEGSYAKGIAAYDAWEKMLGDDSNFHSQNNDGVLFEKMLCQQDAMVCVMDGRAAAAEYFSDVPELAEAFLKTKELIVRMWDLFGRDDEGNIKLQSLADAGIRKEVCSCIRQAKESEEVSLRLMKEMI